MSHRGEGTHIYTILKIFGIIVEIVEVVQKLRWRGTAVHDLGASCAWGPWEEQWEVEGPGQAAAQGAVSAGPLSPEGRSTRVCPVGKAAILARGLAAP